jgi:hypothetical protein
MDAFTTIFNGVFQALLYLIEFLLIVVVGLFALGLVGIILFALFAGDGERPEPLPLPPSRRLHIGAAQASDDDEMLDVAEFLPDEMTVALPDLRHEQLVAMRDKWRALPLKEH